MLLIITVFLACCICIALIYTIIQLINPIDNLHYIISQNQRYFSNSSSTINTCKNCLDITNNSKQPLLKQSRVYFHHIRKKNNSRLKAIFSWIIQVNFIMLHTCSFINSDINNSAMHLDWNISFIQIESSSF